MAPAPHQAALGLLLLALLAPAAGRAQAEADPYAAGLACFEQLDFRCAIELLSAAALTESGREHGQRIDIQRKLAEAHLALGQRPEALSRFEHLLELAPDYALEPGVSPKIRACLEEARRRIKRRTVSASAAGGPAARRFLLGLAGGVELLTGRDRELLEPGLALELQLAYRLGGPWRLAGGLRYASHDLVGGSDSLHLGGGWIGAGAELELGAAVLGANAGLGGGYFGIAAQEGRGALLLVLHAYADWRAAVWLRLGLDCAPGLVVELEQGETSFTASIAGRAAIAF
ncbi:MAG: hypothetical protein JXR96_09030 [Deltaproteobacteria bacterium]|nr:hypothetical protein [Deltaproteobacteria bacterium]